MYSRLSVVVNSPFFPSLSQVLYLYYLFFRLRPLAEQLQFKSEEYDELKLRVESLDNITDSDAVTISKLQQQVNF